MKTELKPFHGYRIVKSTMYGHCSYMSRDPTGSMITAATLKDIKRLIRLKGSELDERSYSSTDV